MPGEVGVEADIQRIALVVVEIEVAFCGRREVGKPASNGAPPSADWLEYARCTCPRFHRRGERSVTSVPRMRAPSIVSGKKISEFPTLLWSKKLFARV